MTVEICLCIPVKVGDFQITVQLKCILGFELVALALCGSDCEACLRHLHTVFKVNILIQNNRVTILNLCKCFLKAGVTSITDHNGILIRLLLVGD